MEFSVTYEIFYLFGHWRRLFFFLTIFFNVFRFMRGEEAKEVCPQIQLVQVPVAHCKADLNTYRNAGSEVQDLENIRTVSSMPLVILI